MGGFQLLSTLTQGVPDRIYDNTHHTVRPFAFDQKVAQAFTDMITRSVPGYAGMVDGIAAIASYYATRHSHIYDLGSSLAGCALAIAHTLHQPSCKIIAVDNAPSMIEYSRPLIADTPHPITLQCADIRQIPIENASVIVLNLTLQFIPVAERQEIIHRCYRGLNAGGVLLLSEKTSTTDAHFDEWHQSFKKNQGYSALAIRQKRAAIEKVLIPQSENYYRAQLSQVGFSDITRWFQCFGFVSFAAIK